MKSSDYLKQSGIFEKKLDYFHPRDSQVEIARHIEDLIGSDDRLLMLEAGTGSGKTLAYLLPAILSGRKAIISTATHKLQDQIYFAEVPLIRRVTGREFSVARLKGRSNYLCIYRFMNSLDSISDRQLFDSTEWSDIASQMELIRVWSIRTRTGDIGEIQDIPENSSVWPMVTSTPDNCLSSKCPRYSDCAVYGNRANAAKSDLVIVNHHLLFGDLLRKEEETGNLLPDAELIVVDEAHHIPEIIQQLSGSSIGTTQLKSLLSDILAEWRRLGADDPYLYEAVVAARQSLERLTQWCLERLQPSELPEGKILETCDYNFAQLREALRRVSDRSVPMGKAYEVLVSWMDLFVLLTQAENVHEDEVRWWEQQGKGLYFKSSLLDPGRLLDSLVKSNNASWVLVSATMTVRESFDYFRRETGLDTVEKTARFDSPFRMENQVRFFMPPDLPEAGDHLHSRSLVDACAPLIKANNGRTFFLFTSIKAMQSAAERLKEILGGESSCIPVLVQGTMQKQQLLDKFQNLQRSTLLATHSFWEGVDVRGSNLTLLIIDKLPFRHPSDPIVSGKMKRLDYAGADGFADYLLPRAVITLRQGFGRLIREEKDRGLFVLGDRRIYSKSYGKVFRDSLPAMVQIDTLQQACDYLSRINGQDASCESG